MSSAWSATIFLSRVFSFSSSLSFFMSVAFMPPNWLRQRCQVDVVISRSADLLGALALGEQLVALFELSDDLLGRVVPSLHGACPPLPIVGVGLASRVAQFTGPRPPGLARTECGTPEVCRLAHSYIPDTDNVFPPQQLLAPAGAADSFVLATLLLRLSNLV